LIEEEKNQTQAWPPPSQVQPPFPERRSVSCLGLVPRQQHMRATTNINPHAQPKACAQLKKFSIQLFPYTDPYYFDASDCDRVCGSYTLWGKRVVLWISHEEEDDDIMKFEWDMMSHIVSFERVWNNMGQPVKVIGPTSHLS